MTRLKLIMALTVVILFAIAIWSRPAATKSNSSIVVNGADSFLPISMSQSSELAAVAQTVSPRAFSEYADATLHQPLVGMSADLQNILAAVRRQVIAEYADGGVRYDLVGVPSALGERLSVVTARVIAGYNDGGYVAKLSYPRLLMNDTVPPIINNFANSLDGTNAKVTWATDEFALCSLRYGTQPGNYTGAVDEALYAKQHTATLNNVTIGAIYYVQATCHDQSDNSATSTEFSFGTDKTAPEISAPNNVTAGKTVTVTWQTNEPATTQLRYGSAPGNYTQTADAPGYATTHRLVLNNLAEGAYYAQIISVDQSGNQTVSPEFSFVIDITPPQVSKISVSGINANDAIVAWETNEPAMVIIEFGTQSGNYTNSVTASLGAGKQQFALPNLAWGTTYFVRLRITDSHGNVTTSTEFTLTTGRPAFLPLIRR